MIKNKDDFNEFINSDILLLPVFGCNTHNSRIDYSKQFFVARVIKVGNRRVSVKPLSSTVMKSFNIGGKLDSSNNGYLCFKSRLDLDEYFLKNDFLFKLRSGEIDFLKFSNESIDSINRIIQSEIEKFSVN